TLHAVGEPLNAVGGVVAGVKHFANVVDPGLRLAGVAELDARRAIPVEGDGAWLLDPTTIHDDAVLNQHGLTGAPRRLGHAFVAVEPLRGGLVDEITVLIALRFAAFGEHLHARQASVDAGGDPKFAAGRENVEVFRQISDKVIDRYLAVHRARSRRRGRES